MGRRLRSVQTAAAVNCCINLPVVSAALLFVHEQTLLILRDVMDMHAVHTEEEIDV
jgi:hypothetical protein